MFIDRSFPQALHLSGESMGDFSGPLDAHWGEVTAPILPSKVSDLVLLLNRRLKARAIERYVIQKTGVCVVFIRTDQIAWVGKLGEVGSKIGQRFGEFTSSETADQISNKFEGKKRGIGKRHASSPLVSFRHDILRDCTEDSPKDLRKFNESGPSGQPVMVQWCTGCQEPRNRQTSSPSLR